MQCIFCTEITITKSSHEKMTVTGKCQTKYMYLFNKIRI